MGRGGRRRDGWKGRGEEKRGGEGGEGKGEEAFLVMWPRRLSALNPPLRQIDVRCASSLNAPTLGVEA